MQGEALELLAVKRLAIFLFMKGMRIRCQTVITHAHPQPQQPERVRWMLVAEVILAASHHERSKD